MARQDVPTRLAYSIPPFLVEWYGTFGVRVVNFVAALSAGVRTLHSAVAGLGGCPFPPGTTRNAATGYILYASKHPSYSAAGDLDALVAFG